MAPKGSPTKNVKGTDDADIQSKINEIISEGGSGGMGVKMEVDYSSTVEEKIPQAKELAAKNKLEDALEMLLALEKQTRTGADMHSTSKVLVAIVQICFEAQNWTLLNEHIILLSKKRSQLKAAVAKMVQQCYAWVKDAKLPSKEIELKLIETLRTITKGKIYVEVERARLTHRLSQMQEADGDIAAAAKTMQDLQVETYGSMDKKEKVELILDQIRLCLATKDYIRAQIISKKISIRFFENVEHQELKLTFYKYMIELDQHEGTYLNICRHYRAIYDTPCIKEDDTKKLDTLKHMALYVILSPYDNEQSDAIHHILKEKPLNKILHYKGLLEQFTNLELIDYKVFSSQYEAHLRNGTDGITPTSVFENTDAGQKRWDDMKKRVVEHNIRIMATYYTRITLKRMANLLALTEAETEDFLSTMVVNKTVEAKTDRLDGVVDFVKHQDPNDMLNNWSHSVSELLSLVMKTTHLVNKEEMVHKHLLGGGTAVSKSEN